MKIISLWSGPRNISTALMYAFAQHPQVEVIDEPLYGHYLRISGADHPGRDEVLSAMEVDGEKVLQSIIERDAEILFLKNMAHHWEALDSSWLKRFDHVLLTREPEDMLTSLVNQLPNPTLRDTGYKKQVELLQLLGNDTPVIVAQDLLKNPEGILRQVCNRLGIAFTKDMLTWPAGPHPADGVWARHWYHNVHRSTGFAPYVPKNTAVPSHLQDLLTECQSYFNILKDHAITTN